MIGADRPGPVLVLGTGTGVGKTWLTCALVTELRRRGLTVSVRKPVQSFDQSPGLETDAEILARASGEAAEHVCPRHRWYPLAMAPPMAAEALGLQPFTIASLRAGMVWPQVDARLVEGAGGVMSPIAADGDGADLARLLQARRVVLVGDAGLGVLNSVRLAAPALEGLDVLVFLNRFDGRRELHRRNLAWLREREGMAVAVEVVEVATVIMRDLEGEPGTPPRRTP